MRWTMRSSVGARIARADISAQHVMIACGSWSAISRSICSGAAGAGVPVTSVWPAASMTPRSTLVSGHAKSVCTTTPT
jgi:hypothetical protein